ncbi:prephenate dehydratase [Mesonia aestuariivivens]|uniref:prephenate dehydratase n=1 Tax=Mesonia aestuariivivens TaxID=2796128 RepID=A0ABS6W4B7_9FLAO|nr:prephenate dehydratase [Mesonia aestuariivivens]MBW2962664.1 prephenate dehydratase [Mesonia aestuariivivens]
MKNGVIAIQGIEGSFHHQVAREYFGEQVQVSMCASFKELAEQVSQNLVTKAVMAIENSTAGSILPNYAYIDEYGLEVIGEHYIPVNMNLMALPGETLESITEVYSHPIALLQCKNFFKQYPHIKLIEDNDTAEAAKRIAQKGLRNTAAIASKTAAEIFKLKVLAESIHSQQTNTTRFLILSKEGEQVAQADKASLKLILKHEQGSLLKALQILDRFGLDMTKIQSLPIVDEPWKYSFFIDVIFKELATFLEAITALEKVSEAHKILGIYKNKNHETRQ